MEKWEVEAVGFAGNGISGMGMSSNGKSGWLALVGGGHRFIDGTVFVEASFGF